MYRHSQQYPLNNHPPPQNQAASTATNGNTLQVPHYITTCYPFVQEYYPYYFAPGNNHHIHQNYQNQRPRRQRTQKRQPSKVDVSLQCNLSPSNSTKLPNTESANQGDPDSDSGYCSPKQRAQKSSSDSTTQALDKLNSTKSPDIVSPSQTQNQSQPSYSQIVSGNNPTTSRIFENTTINNNNPVGSIQSQFNPESVDAETLQTRRKAKKAERAQKKADLEYAEILAEEDRLAKRTIYPNIMDPNSLKKKGKIRENAKNKKPTPLKRVILKEREEKKIARDNVHETILDQTDEVPPLPAILDGIAGPDIQDCVESSRIHSRRFREYCDQVIDKDIDELTTNILNDLNRFYQRQQARNPHKAKSKRRFVLGIREVFKHLKLGKIKCVIVSPNLEKIQSKGGLDDILSQVLEHCEKTELPIVFALGRRALGRACGKFVPVSIVGIFDYSGCEENYKKLLDTVNDARERYQKLVGSVTREIECEKERVQEARDAQVDEQIKLDKHNNLTENIMTNGIQENDEEIIQNGLTNLHLNAGFKVPKPQDGRKSYQQHSRNASAASGISVCSYVSQSETNWKDVVEYTDDDEKTPIETHKPLENGESKKTFQMS